MTFLISLLEPSERSSALEIVERKGLGHPDSICDALAEELSRVLCQYYLEHFGVILHHNVDKGLLCGGRARVWLGGGEVLEPIDIFLSGRATERVGDARIPVENLAVESSRAWLKKNLRHLDVDRHLRIHCHIRPGSTELNELFLRPGELEVPLANDTSCGVGYAPLDALEQTVLETERQLNAANTKSRCPALGEDIKVMGVRRDGLVDLTVACAIVATHVHDLDEYRAAKAQVAAITRETASKHGLTIGQVAVNAGDGKTVDSLYLTLTGTSAESGDDGEVGRGNRINGLVSFYRPMSMEAAAGKNPVSHVGKLYNLLAHRLAHMLVAIPGVESAHCYLLGQIGRPIDQPAVAEIRLKLAQECELAEVEADVRATAADCLGGVRELWRDLITGATTLF